MRVATRATSTSGTTLETVVRSVTPATTSVKFTVAPAPAGSATRRVTDEKPLHAARCLVARQQCDRTVFTLTTRIQGHRASVQGMGNRDGSVREPRAGLVGYDTGEVGANRLPERAGYRTGLT